MKITNNRSRGAWFHYKANGMPKRVYLKGYETLTVPDVTNIDQPVHKKTISNFTAEKPAADSGETTTTVTTRSVPKVDARPIGFDQQTNGNFEVEYTSS